MNYILPRTYILIGCLSALGACRQPAPVDPVPSASCLVDTYSLVTGTTSRTFQYNADRQPVKVLYKDGNQLIASDTLLYDAQKRLTIIKNVRASGATAMQYVFMYDGVNAVPNGYTWTFPTGLAITSRFMFNANNQLTQESLETTPVNTRVFVYDQQNDLQRCDLTVGMGSTAQTYTDQLVSTSDADQNPWRSSLGLQLWSYLRLGEEAIFSAHNVTKDLFASNTVLTNNVLTPVSVERTYIYRYNERDFPLEQTVSSSQYVSKYVFTYNCP